MSITIAPKGRGWMVRVEDEGAFMKAYNGAESMAYGYTREKQWRTLGRKIRNNGKVTGKEVS